MMTELQNELEQVYELLDCIPVNGINAERMAEGRHGG